MKIKAFLYPLTVLTIVFCFSCKKTKLTGDNKKYAGTWHWSGGYFDNGATNIKLIIGKGGRYELFKGVALIEHGILVKNTTNFKFVRNPDPINLIPQEFSVNGRYIERIYNSELVVGCFAPTERILLLNNYDISYYNSGSYLINNHPLQ